MVAAGLVYGIYAADEPSGLLRREIRPAGPQVVVAWSENP
jgi:hypothetical protein